jgi:hypothetical protein
VNWVEMSQDSVQWWAMTLVVLKPLGYHRVNDLVGDQSFMVVCRILSLRFLAVALYSCRMVIFISETVHSSSR